MTEASLGGQIAKGATLIAISRIFVRFLGVINTLILARILVPEDFGLVAIGITLFQLLQNLSDIGVSQTVIRMGTDDRRVVNTLFTLSCLRGGLVALILAIFAFLAPSVYDDPRLVNIFLGFAVIAIIQSLINPAFHEFERNLDFTKEFLISITNKLISVAVSIGVALAFQTYWAIILGFFCGVLTQTVLSWAFKPSIPRFDLSAAPRLIGFTGWVTGVSFVVALTNKLDTLILGRLTGAGPTGLFFMSSQLSMLPTEELAGPFARAVYPALTSVRDDPVAMRNMYLENAQTIAIIALPAAFGLTFLADPLIRLLLKEEWLPIVPIICLLAPTYGLTTIFLGTQAFAFARNMAQLVFIRQLVFLILKIPLFIWAAKTHGVMGAAVCTAGLSIAFVGLQMVMYSRLSDRPGWEPLWVARRSLAGVAAMSFYFLCVAPWVGSPPYLILELLLDGIIAASTFGLTVFALWSLEKRPDGIEATLWRQAQSLRKA